MPLYCHNPPNPSSCEICKRYVSDPWFRRAVDRKADGSRRGRIVERFSPAPSCGHVGEPTGEVLPCAACNRVYSVPVLSCEIHGKCTSDRLVSGVACCRVCPDNAPQLRG